MAYKKRGGFKGKRRMSRRPAKRSFKRKRMVRSAPISINRAPISYTREIPLNNLTITTGTNKVFFGYTFTADQLPNISDFQGLFDQYRIRSIVMKFRLVQPPEAQNTTAASQFYPDIYCTVDHDDATTPTTIDEILQYGKCKRGVLRPNYFFRYRLFPTTAQQLYRTGTTTVYAPLRNKQWIDLAYINTPYYALKGAVSNEASGVTTSPIAIEVHMVMTIQYKSAR